MDLRELTPDEQGSPGNPARVAEVLQTASALDDVTPFLLFPVRIETRFRQREEAVQDPLGLDRLTALLAPAAVALEEIAGRDLATVLTGTVREKTRFKKRTEEPLYEFLETALADVRSALERAEAEARNPLEGTAADAAELRSAAARIGAGLEAARESISGLRSDYQRERFLAELDELRAPAEAVLGVVAHRTLPTADLLRELRRGARARGPEVAPTRLGDSAEAYDAGMAALSSLDAALEAERPPGPGRQVEHMAELGRTAVEGARAATADLDTISVLPERQRRRLVERAEAVAAHADSLTERLRRAGRGGGRAAAELAPLAGELEAILARLRSGARAVPGAAGWGGLARTRVVDELLVRIMPDDIAVDAHEEALTESERDAGFTYWRETVTAGTDETLARGAWRALCLRHGTRRAAWIALRTRPRRRPAPDREAVSALLEALRTLDRRIDEIAKTWPNERIQPLVRAARSVEEALDRLDAVPRAAGRRVGDLTATLEVKLRGLDADPPRGEAGREYRRARRYLDGLVRRLEELVAADPAPDDPGELEFPEVGLREGSWTSAPGSPVLPARFLVVTVSGDHASHVVAGEPVPSDLKLGLDPDPATGEAELFGLDEQGELVVGDSIRWMTDYEEARRRGMAVTVRITPEEARSGFDRVYVLGLRGGDADDGRDRLERLIDSHHFGPSGLSFLSVGTPTNNTEEEPSGFSGLDDAESAYETERGDPLFDAAAEPSEAADGARVSWALGVDPERLEHVAGAGGREIADAGLMDRVLYPATIGNALEELLGSVLTLDTRDRVAAYALRHVRGRGLCRASGWETSRTACCPQRRSRGSCPRPGGS